MPIHIREYREADSVEQITLLLNRAYAELAAMGLRYEATWQTPEMTAEIIADGICFLALDGEALVGTAMLYATELESSCPYYREAGVFHFGKFAASPDRRGEGIGKMLYGHLEDRARVEGAMILACDTAEQAAHLIAMYERWGFEIVARQDWSGTNYISVVLSKSL